MSAPALKRYRVVAIEWLSHDAILEAAITMAKEAGAGRLWASNGEQLRQLRHWIEVQVEEITTKKGSPTTCSKSYA